MEYRRRKRSVRCYFFDNDGNPVRGIGCNKPAMACPFVHPSEPDWADLPDIQPRVGRRTYDGEHSPRSPPKLLNRITNRRSRSPEASGLWHRSRSPLRQLPVSPSSSSRFLPPTPTRGQLRDSRAPTDSIASSSASIHFPRQPRAMPTPIPSTPLPLLPTPPTLISVKPPPPPRTELSFDERRKAWAERIQLLSDSLQQRTSLAKLGQDINLLKSLLSVNTVLDPGKRNLETRLLTLESQREDAKKNYDAVLNRITAIETWPVAPPIEHESRDILNKMMKYCEDLQHSAEEVNRILSRSVVPSSDARARDSSRPLKRRRMDGDREEALDNTSEMDEELRDRVLAMHGTITNIQNDQTAIRNDLVTEYKDYVETKFEEATMEITKSVEDRMKALESGINATGDDVGELAGDIEQLMLDNDAFKTEIADTNQKIKETQTRITQLEEKVQQMSEGRSQSVKAIEALRAAHAAHVSRPAPPLIAPTLPQIGYVVESVQDPLMEAARAAIKPMLTSMRENIQALLQERNTEMYQTLWKRLSLTLKLVDVLSARLTPPHGDGVQPGTA
ncbi:hypothetical protein APHAL10511_001166 [Amanita phalloides]|nr:hypothetical protein APHAL10511_001166 [Amanita phalloides]